MPEPVVDCQLTFTKLKIFVRSVYTVPVKTGPVSVITPGIRCTQHRRRRVLFLAGVSALAEIAGVPRYGQIHNNTGKVPFEESVGKMGDPGPRAGGVTLLLDLDSKI